MLMTILRALFVLLVAGVAMSYAENESSQTMPALAGLIISLGLALVVIGVDVFVPRKSLMAISGVFFGLIVGMVVTYGCGLVLDLMVSAYKTRSGESILSPTLIHTTKILIGVIACYLSVSFILQTKDDVRFVIPYVEFAKQRKGQHAMILDTSVIIDGRIVDVLDTWRTDAAIIIPRFVLQELQAVADSQDKLKRNRGRRGLDIVNKLQGMESVDLQFQDVRLSPEGSTESVDQRLVTLGQEIDGRIVTNDYNLNKVAKIRGVEVMNVNDLANALKPVFLPGETMQVKIIKPGEEPGQGVGYLEDGTMVVVEAARDHVGDMMPIVVTSVLQTSAGRMVFGRPQGTPPQDHPRRRSSHAPT